MRKFWKWKKQDGNQPGDGAGTDGTDTVPKRHHRRGNWFDDDITPALFKDELMSESGRVTVWINSPGGDCVAAAQIYNMLKDYKDSVTVKIDGIAARRSKRDRYGRR